MSFFNPEVPLKEKVITSHPWEKYIKDAYAGTYKYGHNSAKNPVYPPPKPAKVPALHRAKFTVIGNRVTKEFIYCTHLVKLLYKYRWKHFVAPVIRGVTGVEWPKVSNDLKIQYGGLSYCLDSQVVVLLNDHYLGGEKELKEIVEDKFLYHFTPDYYAEAIKQFSNYIRSSGRPCAYLQISIDDSVLGTLIFMLYSDIAPRTCENFLRLCKTNKGGYAGTPVHRIVKDGWIQCGGFGIKDSGLDCENFIVPHDRRGLLGMCNDGRHVDCSTQFFVLLQPADWMANKYVAFGHLIDGEETLKKIEEIPTWYESPTKPITIFRAGILNLECQDITINKGTHKYIEGHIENLFTVGELFYEALLEKVFLEADFRSLQRLQDEIAGEGAEFTPEEAARNLHATQRFMRKKEEIEKHLEKSLAVTPIKTADDKGENNDFDVEEYEYEPEEYSYKQVSVKASESVAAKPDKPFYIPLTDVLYPGEVDSTFDLKRLLQGDYCLESDLDKDADKKRKMGAERLSFPSELFDALFGRTPSESESRETLDSEEEKEIKKYLKNNADRVSFAGDIVKAVAKSGRYNLLENQKGSDLITDENLRKYKLAEEEYRSHREKSVSISLPAASDTHKEIKRRQTGFVRKEDLARLRKLSMANAEYERDEDDDDDDEEFDAYQPYTRQVSISEHSSPEKDKAKQVKRRQTGFVRPADLEKMHIFDKKKGQDDDEDDDEDDGEMKSTHVRISDDAGIKPIAGRLQRPSEDSQEPERPSVLQRLLDIDDVFSDEAAPTLKDYKPISEQQKEKTSLFLTHSPAYLIKCTDDPKERFRRRSIALDVPTNTIDQVLLLQHGKKVYRKISSDYVRTIDQIEQKTTNSLRTVEYARKRPAISVHDYQKKNQEYQKTKLEIEQLHTILDEKTSRHKGRIAGLRLPGDTPLYDSSTTV